METLVSAFFLHFYPDFTRLSGKLTRPINRGCVTPDILVELGASGIESTSGFKRLRCVFVSSPLQPQAKAARSVADQKKVRLAIATRRVGARDITRPNPAGTLTLPGHSTPAAVGSSIPAKRRAEDNQPLASGSGANSNSSFISAL